MLGIGGVTLVLVALLSIAAGFKVALEGSGSDDVAIIMRAGSTNELSGGFGADRSRWLAMRRASSAMRRTSPILSPELYVLVDGRMRGKDASTNLPLRGVSPMAPQVRKSFKLVRDACSAKARTKSSSATASCKQYEGLDVGKTVRWGNANWNVVGRFTDGGGIAESEAWGDTPIVQQAWHRGNSFQSIRAKLEQSGSAEDTQGCAHQGSARARRRAVASARSTPTSRSSCRPSSTASAGRWPS